MIRNIPYTATFVQEGLYLNVTPFNVNGVTYQRRELYSLDGYCFYNKTIEIYDEAGNVIPNELVTNKQRTHMQYACLGLADDVENYISIPCDGDCEIV